MKTLFIALILFCTQAASAQPEFYNLQYAGWLGYPEIFTDAANMGDDVAYPDSESAGFTAMFSIPGKNYGASGAIQFYFPAGATESSIDSIGLYLSQQCDAEVAVFTSVTRNTLYSDTVLKGPLPYGLYWVKFKHPFGSEHPVYLTVERMLYREDNITENNWGEWTYLDAAIAKGYDFASVTNSTAVETPKLRWFTFPLAQYVYYGTVAEAIEHLPKPAAYITSDGKQYVLGR